MRAANALRTSTMMELNNISPWHRLAAHDAAATIFAKKEESCVTQKHYIHRSVPCQNIRAKLKQLPLTQRMRARAHFERAAGDNATHQQQRLKSDLRNHAPNHGTNHRAHACRRKATVYENPFSLSRSSSTPRLG